MADVKVRIIAVDEASGPISKAGDEIEKTGKKAKEAGNAFEGMGKTMVSIAGALGLQVSLQAIVGGLKNAVVGSFELADALEQSKIAFTTMLGSGEAAGKMLNDLKSFADKTPFEFQDIQAAAKRLMAMGTAAEDVIPTLRAVGDAAAGLGGGKATIDGITLALGQMGAKGKISTQELNQLTERGVPALKYLADAANVSTGEMAKLVEKGLVPASSGVKVLLENMSEDFGGLMAKQAETATGKISTMKDAVASLGTEIGESLVPAAKTGADMIAIMAQKGAEFAHAQNVERVTVESLQQAVRDNVITFEDYKNVTNELGAAAEEVFGTLLITTPVITDVDGATRLLADAQNKLKVRFEESRDEEVRYTAEMAHVKTALEIQKEKVDEAKQALMEYNALVKEQAFLMGVVGGATKEQEQDQKTNTDTIKKTEDAIAKLTKNYRNNQAAILAGHGTVVDNTLAIEKANIAAERAAIQFGKLNERFANQEGIDAFNQGMGEIDEALRDLNTENAKGEMSAEKFAKATEKLSDKQTALRERFDKSKMSQQDFDLSVREHNVNLIEATTRMTNLTTEHGKGYTAAELAAQGTGTYNTKLGLLQIELEKAKQRDIELQTQVATRIKEGILLEEIALAAKTGFTDAEILMIDTAAKALGIADSKAVTGAINTGIAATDLAKLRETYAADFVTENQDGMKAFGAAVDSIGADITNKLRPSMKSAEDAAHEALVELLLFKGAYDSLQSKEIILTVRQQKIFEEQAFTAREQGQDYGNQAQPESSPAAARAAAAANAAAGNFQVGGQKGAKAGGGPVMGGAGAYLVGERGPELFNPSGTGGTITPNNALGRSGLAIGTLNVYGVQSTSELFNQLSREARARGLQFAVN